MYDPTLGRFIQRDPIGFAADDLNVYRYALNRPVDELDALGTDIYVIVDASKLNRYEKLEKNVKEWNDCLDKSIKYFQKQNNFRKNDKFQVDGKDVAREQLIKVLESKRMHIEKLEKAATGKEAMEKLNDVLKNKTEDDEVLFETHSSAFKEKARSIDVAGKAIEIEDFMKKIGTTKAKFVIGGCYFTKELTEELAKAMKTAVGATSGGMHGTWDECAMTRDVDQKAKAVIWNFKSKTPYKAAEFQIQPPKP